MNSPPRKMGHAAVRPAAHQKPAQRCGTRKRITMQQSRNGVALAALQAAFLPKQPYTVLCRKRPGCEIVFSVYDDRTESERVVTQLAAIGCHARSVPAHDDDVPGVQRRSR
jgi:hypothetical protein